MRIRKEDTIAVVIDVQKRLYPFISGNEKLTENIVKLIKGLKAIGIEILVTTQYVKGLGDTIEPVKVALGEYTHMEKISFSCCGDDNFISAVKKSGKKNVIVCGIESHVCVLQTVIDLLEKGYRPVLIEDCVSSRSLNDKKIAVERMRQEGALISTYESILFELLEISGTVTFKEISKIVK
ncbi:MAG: hydrolase [Ignavibacteriae bacterium]|nr:hydrolase [Ignavibacteriota bacterium]